MRSLRCQSFSRIRNLSNKRSIAFVSRFLYMRLQSCIKAMPVGFNVYKTSRSQNCINIEYNNEYLESCSFWFNDTGNTSFFTQIHYFHQVVVCCLSSISLLELNFCVVENLHCHTSKFASWHKDCRYKLHFLFNISKIWNKSPKSGNIKHYCGNYKILNVF